MAWDSDGNQVALFVPPHGSALVLFAYADLPPRLCQFTVTQRAREEFERTVTSWRSSGVLEELND